MAHSTAIGHPPPTYKAPPGFVPSTVHLPPMGAWPAMGSAGPDPSGTGPGPGPSSTGAPLDTPPEGLDFTMQPPSSMLELVDFAEQLLAAHPEHTAAAVDLHGLCRSGQRPTPFPHGAIATTASEAAAALLKSVVLAANLVDRHGHMIGGLWAELAFSFQAMAEAGIPPAWPQPAKTNAILDSAADTHLARAIVHFICARSRWAKQS